MENVTLERILCEITDTKVHLASIDEKLTTNRSDHEEIRASVKGIEDTLAGKSNGETPMSYERVKKFVRDADTQENWDAWRLARGYRQCLAAMLPIVIVASCSALAGWLLWMYAKHPSVGG